MNKENACSSVLGLFYNSLSCKKVKESIFFSYPLFFVKLSVSHSFA